MLSSVAFKRCLQALFSSVVFKLCFQALFSSVAFNLNLRHYNKANLNRLMAFHTGQVGWCRFTPG